MDGSHTDGWANVVAVPANGVNMTATRWSILLTIVLGTAIGILTLMPPTQMDMPSGSDKPSHFIAFMALALPLAIVRPRWSGVMFVIFATFGAAIEIIQPYVGRSRELADLIADMAGIVCGMLLGLLAGRMFPALHPAGTRRR